MHSNRQTNMGGSTSRVVGGMVIGALFGATAMLFLAPHSGRKTREMLAEGGMELRDQVSEKVSSLADTVSGTVGDVVEPVKDTARKMMDTVHKQGKELQESEEDIIAQGKKEITNNIDEQRKAIHDATKK